MFKVSYECRTVSYPNSNYLNKTLIAVQFDYKNMYQFFVIKLQKIKYKTYFVVYKIINIYIHFFSEQILSKRIFITLEHI